METFCIALKKHNIHLNEKGCLSYSADEMLNNDDIGLIALDAQCIGNRGNKNKTKCGISDIQLNKLYNNIIDKINVINNKEQKKIYIGYLLKLLYKIRDIHNGNGERDIFYKLNSDYLIFAFYIPLLPIFISL